MLRAWWVIVLALVIGNEANAGLHLGMKLACKRYGEAWQSGNLGALQSVTTSDFAAAWGRVPSAHFQAMPRSGGGEVLDTQKGSGSGLVSVATADGVVQFVVVGGGFDWTVADIRKRNDEGQFVSVKETLNAACTTREFTTIFASPENNSSLNAVASDRLQAAVATIPETTMNRIRTSLRRGQTTSTPKVHFRSFGAVVTVSTSNTDPNERVIFHLVNDGGWKVDDVGFATQRLEISSLRQNLPAFAAISDFGAFCRGERKVPPAQFAAEGDLLEELTWLHENEKPFPRENRGAPVRLKIGADNRWAQLFWETHRVTIDLSTVAGKTKIDQILLITDEKQQDVAAMLANYRRVQSLAEGQPAVKLLGLVFDTGSE